MHPSRSLRLFLAAAMAVSALPAQAGFFDALADFQKPNIHVGQLEVHPYYSLTEKYDSNIFLQPTSHVVGNNANNNTAGPVLGSWITENNFGVKTKLPLSDMHKFRFDYDFLWRAYKKDPSTNNTVNQAVDGGYHYSGPEGISADVGDSYLNTADPATTELTQRQKRWQNTGAATVEYAPEGGNLFAAVDGQHTTHKYIANDPTIRLLLNRYDQSFGVRAGWRLQPKTRVYVGYHREIIHYTVHQSEPTKDNKDHLIDVGIEGDIAPKLTGKVSAGMVNRKYDVAVTGSNKRVRDDWTVGVGLDYRPIERTDVNLSASRSLQEAVLAGNDFYVASNVGLSVTHKFPYKVTGGVTTGWENDKYQNAIALGGITAVRRDDLYQVGALVGYDIQEWLKVSASYLYRTRFSRFTEQFNYRDHLTALTASVLF